MKATVSIFTIGAEILDGRILDTNSRYLARFLTDKGFEVARMHSCGDTLADITRGLKDLTELSDLVICCGGLGPTSDDITRDAIAEFCARPLVKDVSVEEQLIAYYTKRNRQYDPTNNSQAFFPKDSTILNNPVGTAAGFALKTNTQKLIIALPGVPYELEHLIINEVHPLLNEFFPILTKVKHKVFRTFGLPEAKIGSLINALNIEPEIKISYRAHFPEVIVQLSANPSAESLLESSVALVQQTLAPENIYSTSNEFDLPQLIMNLCVDKKLKLAVAESCTGGLLGKFLTDMTGASAFFLGGIISYSNQAKQSLLNVPAETLDKFGAVSAETAQAMATGVRNKFNSDLAISITGIAGLDGGSEVKPVGTFYLGLASKDRVSAMHYFYPHQRERVRLYAAWSAMDVLRRHILGLH
jgi:nicotinamide-nucleotide amidase